MFDLLTSPIIYSKAVVLIGTALLMLFWLSYFIISSHKKAGTNQFKTFRFYILYSIGLFFWIVSNAYFHTELLVIFSNKVAIFMAVFANISGFLAFTFAFLFTCQLRSEISKASIPRVYYVIVGLCVIYALTINIIPDLTIVDVHVEGVSNFIIVFGEHTQGFFIILMSLVALTLINLLHIRRSANRLGQARITYMILGIAIFMISTAVIQLGFTYLLNDFSLTWLPPALSISEMLMVGYALLTQRFFSGRYILFFSLTLFLTSSVYTLLYLGLSQLLTPSQVAINAIIWCMFIGVTWRYVFNKIKCYVSLVVYQSTQTPLDDINSLVSEFQSSPSVAMAKLSKLLDVPHSKIQLIQTSDEDEVYTKQIHQYGNALIFDEIKDQMDRSTTEHSSELEKLYAKMNNTDIAMMLPLFGDSQDVTHFLVSPHKNSGRLFSQEEILALQRMLKKTQGYINMECKVRQSQALANTIAHEMRNPLAQVLIHFEKLRSQIDSNSGVHTLEKEIECGKSAVERGKQLIDIILREVNTASLDDEPSSSYSVKQLLNASIEQYGFESKAHKQRVQLSISSDFYVKVNETLFNFVIFNLLRNAIHYFDSYPDSQIEISVMQKDTQNHVIVRDTGPGIPEKIQTHIFNDFFSHNKSGGSGLGLGYCQRVMNSFGGTIQCQSSLGEFTEFQLLFPAIAMANTKDKPIENKQDYRNIVTSFDTQPFSHKHILVVDDKEVQRALVTLYLEQLDLGLNIIQANNGKTAIDIFKSNPIDLVIMDVQMPVMNGFDASIELKKISPTTPIIALSGESGEKELSMITQLMDDYLCKPAGQEALEEKVLKWLNKSQESQLVH
ncbi:hybrid sensor histidine kinase/response regulator [Vibrio sp. ZSDE26]|uniref:histidine kinase n=1 Tax=Vibrio amylolyticus TaxID=2847292 RepID=A0A9X2BI00_9VIBR|nr:hybrid sensor histidine kinase/response regulator [Vibrio amylolyticus]MCK6261862.1 hybrid sensor histidine kinase/response regulator [Vibrio amylolyticus]